MCGYKKRRETYLFPPFLLTTAMISLLPCLSVGTGYATRLFGTFTIASGKRPPVGPRFSPSHIWPCHKEQALKDA